MKTNKDNESACWRVELEEEMLFHGDKSKIVDFIAGNSKWASANALPKTFDSVMDDQCPCYPWDTRPWTLWTEERVYFSHISVTYHSAVGSIPLKPNKAHKPFLLGFYKARNL